MQLGSIKSVETLPRVGSDFVEVCYTDDFSTMTREIAVRNLTLLAAFTDFNRLGINPKDFRELTLSAPKADDECAWHSVEDKVVAVIEASFCIEKKGVKRWMSLLL